MPLPVGWFFTSDTTPETGRSVFITPWTDRGYDFHGSNADDYQRREQASSILTGGWVFNRGTDGSGAVGGWIEFRAHISKGTYKLGQITPKNTNYGIMTWKLDGTSVGTIDVYGASFVNNIYSEITGISIATAGTKTVREIVESKNASSTFYYNYLQTVALLRTGA